MPGNVEARNEINRDTLHSIQHYSGQPIQLLGRRIEELEEEVPLEALVYRGGALMTIGALTLLLLQAQKQSSLALRRSDRRAPAPIFLSRQKRAHRYFAKTRLSLTKRDRSREMRTSSTSR